MTATTADAYRPARTVAFLPAATLIVIGIFSTTLAQDALLGRLPLLNLLKNELHVSRTASSDSSSWRASPGTSSRWPGS